MQQAQVFAMRMKQNLLDRIFEQAVERGAIKGLTGVYDKTAVAGTGLYKAKVETIGMAVAVELKVYGKLGGGAEVLNAIAQELGGGDELNGVTVVFGFEIHWYKLRG